MENRGSVLPVITASRPLFNECVLCASAVPFADGVVHNRNTHARLHTPLGALSVGRVKEDLGGTLAVSPSHLAQNPRGRSRPERLMSNV